MGTGDKVYICVERIVMILNELLDTNCVEVYTPDVYHILFDAFIQCPNTMVKAMSFKLLAHLECNWQIYASDPLKDAKPKRMNASIHNRLQSMFAKLYFMEKQSENDHFSLLFNSLSEFLSRVDWENTIKL